jgi:uncharacterized protein
VALVFEIKIVPSSGRQQIVLDKSGLLKCFLKSAAENGKANAELIKFLAKKLKIIQDDVSILVGKKVRRKRIKINQDISFDGLLEKLEVKK